MGAAKSYRCTSLGAGCAAIAASGLMGISPAISAVLPPLYADTVVALGEHLCQQLQPPPQPPVCGWATEGTGFEYGYLIHDDPNPAERRYRVFLVTARHVVDGHQGAMSVRLNPTSGGGPGKEFTIPNEWGFHPNKDVDVAVLSLGIEDLISKGLQSTFVSSDTMADTTDKMKSDGVSAGDGVFVLGFPMNMAGKERNYVIVRQGIIARLSEMLDHASNTFLVDTFVFPGNSGGPVFSRPQLESIEGTKPQERSNLIGIVLAYDQYTDTAWSLQTKTPRISFMENSGLAEILPVDYINEAIKAWFEAHAKPKTQ